MLGWVTVPTIRGGEDTNITTEIRNRLPDTGIMEGEDKVGEGHYGGHGLNSYLRKGKNNASYMPGGIAFIAPEPIQFTLRDVIAKAGRFPASKLAVNFWDKRPLYVFDELSAYTCGTLSGIHARQTDTTRTKFSYKCAQDLLRTAEAVADLAKEKGYQDAEHLERYVKYVKGLHNKLIAPYCHPYR